MSESKELLEATIKGLEEKLSSVTGDLNMKNRELEELNKMEKITQEQFEAYVNVQMSGVTNMWNVKLVGELSGLEEEEIMTIMKNYGQLKEKYDE